MALFPQHFIEDLKRQADIVVVIQDYVSLKKTGATYKGLCPFHREKTPSFHVNRDRGFFHCFGCNVGGDVLKFLELHEQVGFQDAVKLLARRVGLELPELEEGDDRRTDAAERESLLKVHDVAAAWFAEQLASPAGARLRQYVAERGLTPATAASLRLGFAPPARSALTAYLSAQGFATGILVRGGLAVQREDGSIVDRFRNRLMIPISRDTGSVIAFGGRAVAADQQPKYLNSPETPIYSKSRTLYGLELSKAAIRQSGFAVLVEGYFDFAQVYQGGIQAVVATCGTALTATQAALLRRFTSKVVLSYDPDNAGQGATARSGELLLADGFDVNVAVLPPGEDPDTFIQRRGGEEYRKRLRDSRPLLEYLLDRAAARADLRTMEGRARLVAEMVPVAARITDTVRRQLFAEAVSGRARVPHEMVWLEMQQGLVAGRPGPPQRDKRLPAGAVTKAERALCWWLVHRPADALRALDGIEAGDTEELGSKGVLDVVRKLVDDKGFSPAALLERLDDDDSAIVTEAAAEPEPPSLDPVSCVRILRKRRFERERAATQAEIDRLLKGGPADDGALNALLERNLDLRRRIETLVTTED